jgi:hypothetical protein
VERALGTRMSPSSRRTTSSRNLRAPQFTSACRRPAASHWCCGISSAANVATWGSDPTADISLAEKRRRAIAHRNQRHARRQGRSKAGAAACSREGAHFPRGRPGIHRPLRSGLAQREAPAAMAQHVNPASIPLLEELPIAAIDTALVVRVLDPVRTEKPETASRVRGRIEAVLDAATVLGPSLSEGRGALSRLREAICHASSSSNAFASLRSGVPKPSVNQP